MRSQCRIHLFLLPGNRQDWKESQGFAPVLPPFQNMKAQHPHSPCQVPSTHLSKICPPQHRSYGFLPFCLHITHHISHITHHTSHITHHTSHITHHPSLVFRCIYFI